MPFNHLTLALRQLLREKGCSQAAFAKALGISLPTAKRWLRGEGISFQDWLRALEASGISLGELIERAGLDNYRQFSYSPAQDKALAQTPGLLAYFDQLLAGKAPAEIARAHRLPKTATAQYLGALAKVGLIEWLPKDRARLLVRGEPRWNPQGPLAQKFRRQTLREFTDRFGDDPGALRLGIYELSEETEGALPGLFTEFLEKLRHREISDARSPRARRKVTVVVGGARLLPAMLRLPNA